MKLERVPGFQSYRVRRDGETVFFVNRMAPNWKGCRWVLHRGPDWTGERLAECHTLKEIRGEIAKLGN